jgi:hypothetical protein
LPSTKKVRIRENNGEDEGILSTIGGAVSGESTYSYISNIIVKDYDAPEKSSILVDDIKKWKINDKYYLLFKQRIINLGNDLVFEFNCINNTCVENKTQLSKYNEDLSKIDELAEHLNYPGEKQDEFEFMVDNFKLRFQVMNGEMELGFQTLQDRLKNRNSNLIARKLSLFHENEWIPLTSFHMFSSKQMGIIRGTIQKYDKGFSPTTDFNCPHCNTPYSIPVLSLPTFFFPEGDSAI